MSTKTRKKEINDHGEEVEKPLFGPDYNPQTTPLGNPSDPRGDVAAGDSSDPRAEKSLSDEELAKREVSDNNKAEDKAGADEKDSLFSGEEAPSRFSRFRKRLMVNGKRKAAIGVTILVLGGGTAGFFGFAAGPLKAIHLAQILQRPFATQEDTNSNRIQGLYRYIRTGDVGQTRLSFMESKFHKKIIADMEKEGITIATRDGSGSPTRLTLDGNQNSSLKGLTSEEMRTKIAETYGIDEDKVRPRGGGKTFDVNIGDESIKIKRSFVSTSMGLTQKGTITVHISTRVAAKYYNTPSLFHPIRAAEAAIIDKIAKTGAERKAKQREKNNETTKPSPEAEARVKGIRDKLGTGGKLATVGGAGLTFTGGFCVAKDAIDLIPVLNRENSIQPAIKGAYSAMAYGSQPRAHDDLTIQQLGDFVSTFENDKGEDIFQSKPLNALAGGKNAGVDLDPDLKQSFSPDRTASNLSAAINSVPGADFACSPVGGAIQIIAGGALLVATGGTATAGVKIVTGVLSGVVVSQVISYLQKIIADEPLHERVLAGGPEGGGLLAMGSMSAAGLVAQNFGATAMSTEQSQKIRQERNLSFKNEFNKQGFLTRVFDVKDSRSIASNVIRKSPSNSSDVISNLANTNLLARFSSLLVPSAFAAEPETQYDWPMPEYAFDDGLLNKYPDPRANAETVATFIGGSNYVERAKNCFGVSIVQEDGLWNVIPESEVNPASEEYINADCADRNDENWLRVRVFVLDTRVINGFGCFEGSDEDVDIQKACEDTGLNKESSTTQTITPSVEPPDAINGMPLTAAEKSNLKYIKENVLSLLAGNTDEQAQLAAESAWWSLREGVLALEQPYVFGYSNCQVPVAGTSAETKAKSPGGGNNHIDVTQVCPGGNAWQVGIGGVQVPNFTSSRVNTVVGQRHSGKSVKTVLEELAVLAGHPAGSATHNEIVNSSGDLRKSLLLRDPATGITLVNVSLQPCFKTGSVPSWCSTGKSAISSSLKVRQDAVKEIKDYFLATSGTTSAGNANLDANRDKFTEILKLPSGYIGPPAVGYYNQSTDSRWASKPYPYASGGSNTISASGCGPASLAMTISTLTDTIKNPYEVGLDIKQHHVSGGTAMGGAISYVEKYGLKYKTFSSTTVVAEIKETLSKGGLVIMSANASSPFTQAGHFVVIRAISQDGSQFYVADPADDNGNGLNRNERPWPTSSIPGWTSAGLWGVTK